MPSPREVTSLTVASCTRGLECEAHLEWNPGLGRTRGTCSADECGRTDVEPEPDKTTHRVALNEADFRTLVTGGVVTAEQGVVKIEIILSDIGILNMQAILETVWCENATETRMRRNAELRRLEEPGNG